MTVARLSESISITGSAASLLLAGRLGQPITALPLLSPPGPFLTPFPCHLILYVLEDMASYGQYSLITEEVKHIERSVKQADSVGQAFISCRLKAIKSFRF